MMAVIACWKANTTKQKNSKTLYGGSRCGILHNFHQEIEDEYLNLNFLTRDQERVELLAIVVGNGGIRKVVRAGFWGSHWLLGYKLSCNHVLPQPSESELSESEYDE